MHVSGSSKENKICAEEHLQQKGVTPATQTLYTRDSRAGTLRDDARVSTSGALAREGNEVENINIGSGQNTIPRNS